MLSGHLRTNNYKFSSLRDDMAQNQIIARLPKPQDFVGLVVCWRGCLRKSGNWPGAFFLLSTGGIWVRSPACVGGVAWWMLGNTSTLSYSGGLDNSFMDPVEHGMVKGSLGI